MVGPVIVEGIGSAALLQAMDENLWAFWRDYGRGPGAERLGTADHVVEPDANRVRKMAVATHGRVLASRPAARGKRAAADRSEVGAKDGSTSTAAWPGWCPRCATCWTAWTAPTRWW